MFPFIRWDEQILVEKVSPENTRIGDIVLFQSDKGIKVCHRVVRIQNRNGTLWFQTKGERSRFYDAPISQEAILGKVIALKRKMRLIALNEKSRDYYLFRFESLFARCILSIKKPLSATIYFLQRFRPYRLILGPVLCRDIRFEVSDEENAYRFVACKRDMTVASVYLAYSDNLPHTGWWLWSLKVKLLYRRLGIAKQLVENLISFTRERGIQNLYLNVSTQDPAVLGFYEGLGFNIIPGSERRYENPERTFVYMRWASDHES